MKKIFVLLMLLSLAACEVGNFPKERMEMYQDQTDCQKMPERCINGIPW